MKFYETLPPQLDPPKIDNAVSKQKAIIPTVNAKIVNRVETGMGNNCNYAIYMIRRFLTIRQVSCQSAK